MQRSSFYEKFISILSYFTMGIIGLIWLIFTYLKKKKISFFLMYNIAQSMILSIFLAFINILIDVILRILFILPFLNILAIKINMLLQSRLNFLGLSFTPVETIVFCLLIYVSVGVLLSRILYVPFFTNVMKIIMRSYK